MQNDISTVDAAITPQKGHQIASFTLHDDFDITIIWHNVDTRSHFTRFSIESCGRIERILIDFARVLQTVVLEQFISVNRSKHILCMTMAYANNKEEGVIDAIFSVL
ncbi:hypothetical protein HBI24_119040 [Parastagonospora nodorum]|nr:hypothetical protein HBI24_119040 [Parastagonospora nodorum]